MRSESGIPRPWQPNNQAQEVRDLRRELEELKARRTFVSLERIVEGGTIDANVGKQITDTVQKDIVIDGGNLGEGALDGQRMVGAIIETNDAANRGVKIDDTGLRGYDADGNRYMKADETGLEMTGSISTKGKTAETVPRDMSVELRTVNRITGSDLATPGLVFVTGGTDPALAPGIYSPDGDGLLIGVSDPARGYGMVRADYAGVSLTGTSVTVGGSGFGTTAPPPLNLLGNVKVNGDRVMKTVTPNIPAGQQPIELIASGAAATNASGEFTIMFPTGTFPNACQQIFIVPDSGGAVIPVVNGTGALTKTSCRAVQPGNGNKSITYSYRAIGY